MKISVVVTTYNRPDALDAVLTDYGMAWPVDHPDRVQRD
jgi:hypothetical protein